MGAGKTTLGEELARRIGLPFRDVDREVELLAEHVGHELLRGRGRGGVPGPRGRGDRLRAARHRPRRCSRSAGGAVTQEPVRAALRERAVTSSSTSTPTPPGSAYRAPTARSRRSGPPSSRSTTSARRSTARSRTPSRATSTTPSSPPRASHVERGALQRLGELVPGDGPVALVSDPHVAGIHGMDAQLALGARASPRRTSCRPARRRRRSARSTGSGRSCASTGGGTIAALGGGCTTDAAGFAAAAYLRGDRLGSRPDEPRRAGRRRDRRQDGDRPAAGQEPRRARSTGRCGR